MHVAVAPAPERVHGFGLKVPFPLLLQAMVPDGVIGVPGDVSLTVAVHGVAWWSVRKATAQLTLVIVVRFVTVRLNELELPEWVKSPL
jgi:hypothetical protein